MRLKKVQIHQMIYALSFLYLWFHLNLIHSFDISIFSSSSYSRYQFHLYQQKKGKFYSNSNQKLKKVSSLPRKTTIIPSSSSKAEKPLIEASHSPTIKSFASTTIAGENIVNCRSFTLDNIKSFKFEGSYDNSMVAPIFGLPEIAFIGRSNVGKSSLLNMISGLNKDIAVVSKTPGRTRLINMFKCADKDGDICMFVDLPGKILIRRS